MQKDIKMVVISGFVVIKKKGTLKERSGNEGGPESCLVPFGVWHVIAWLVKEKKNVQSNCMAYLEHTASITSVMW